MNCTSIIGHEEEERINWKIVHIPDKPPVPPHLQPTGSMPDYDFELTARLLKWLYKTKYAILKVDIHACIIDPKDANNFVRKLNRVAPLENLRHVKRVRRISLGEGKIQLSVILCMAFGDDGNLNTIPNDVLELINANQLSTFVAKVPKYAASSKEEWDEQSKIWPTSYHPPTYNIEGITGFSKDDSQLVYTYMKAAIDLAKSIDGQLVNAAIIVDPSPKQVIASACDEVHSTNVKTTINNSSEEQSYSEQLQETPTNSIANKVNNHKPWVSKCSNNETKRLHKIVSCLHPWSWAEQDLGPNLLHPLRHAAIVAIEQSAARDMHLFPNSTVRDDREKLMPEICLQPLSAVPPSKRLKTNNTNHSHKENEGQLNSASDSGRPYLCTGYDIYLVWEPCVMCAMALVHQRIKRIFYAFPNSNAGALGSVQRLQGEKSLNHHYAVFRVVLPQVLDEDAQTSISFTTEDDRVC